jgi:hypothetical protein
VNTGEKRSAATCSPNKTAHLRPHTGVREKCKKKKNRLLTRSASSEMVNYLRTLTSRKEYRYLGLGRVN